jgi:hypothetical protein
LRINVVVAAILSLVALPVSASGPDTTDPMEPTNVRLTSSTAWDPDLHLRWTHEAPSWAWDAAVDPGNDATGVAHYQVFLDDAWFPTDVTGTTFTLPVVNEGSPDEFEDGGYHCIRVRAVDKAGNIGPLADITCSPYYDVWAPRLSVLSAPSLGRLYHLGHEIAVDDLDPNAEPVVVGAFTTTVRATESYTSLRMLGILVGEREVATFNWDPEVPCNVMGSRSATCVFVDGDAEGSDRGIAHRVLDISAVDGAFNLNTSLVSYVKPRLVAIEEPCGPSFCVRLLLDDDCSCASTDLDKDFESLSILYKREVGSLAGWFPLTTKLGKTEFVDTARTVVGRSYEYAWGVASAGEISIVSNIAHVDAAHDGTRLGTFSEGPATFP